MCVRNSADPTVKYGCNCPCGYLSLINNLVRSRSTSKLIPVTLQWKTEKITGGKLEKVIGWCRLKMEHVDHKPCG